MSERLQQLQRQQSLIREHLAWLEAEIAKERGNDSSGLAARDSLSKEGPFTNSPVSSDLLPQPVSETSSPASDTTLTRQGQQLPPNLLHAIAASQNTAVANRPTFLTPVVLTPEAQVLIDQYSADESNKRENARRGCFIIFAVALAVLILGVGAVWWFGYRKAA